MVSEPDVDSQPVEVPSVPTTTQDAYEIVDAAPPPVTFKEFSSSYKEAILDPLWQQAMAEELSALYKTGTWDIVPLPVGKRAIGSRWIYKIKTKSDGSVERYKARLVTKGFDKEYGMDYEENFAPVSKHTTIRTLIVVASA
ncbi:uncharacterized mitochondrial protein AtMg00820-like [Humulus lupulus]|uniref:uncharacterized mitochondrial protein AtMg00820-like n=1 Tax=Humulus lupulus TaxID=3486 RepID=UPI002B409F79|nr:uncharacterized mitochondrial protein AtMg00820-like [Humulus lupulus]